METTSVTRLTITTYTNNWCPRRNPRHTDMSLIMVPEARETCSKECGLNLDEYFKEMRLNTKKFFERHNHSVKCPCGTECCNPICQCRTGGITINKRKLNVV